MAGIKTCFVLEPCYKPGDSEAKRRLDLIYNRIIEPSIDAHNFRILRSSELAQPEFISRDHISLAANSELLIADLTGGDPVVFYCLAHRMAKVELTDEAEKQPVIAMMEFGDADRFYLTGPTAYPVRYVLTPNEDAPTESAKLQSMERNLVNARRDLTQAVRRRLMLTHAESTRTNANGSNRAAEEKAEQPANQGAKTEAGAGRKADVDGSVSLEELIARAMRGGQ